MKTQEIFDGFIFIVIIVKFILIGLIIYNRLLMEKISRLGSNATSVEKENAQNREKTIHFWKIRVEFIFVFLMSIVLIYLFYPRNKFFPVYINFHTKLLIYLYGILTILTANWDLFIDTSIIWSAIPNIEKI